MDVRSSAGLPTVYLDVVRSGQTVLTQWLDVKDGKAEYNLDLPQSLFGTLEIHAYQMLAGGEIIRDSRVVYVQPANDLKIDVKADRDVYLPGADGKITFRVTDADGKPAAAALGVLVVDEAVYALQEMQPGLEKVYFTLQEELLKPQAQVLYKPSETVETLVRQPALTRRPAADRRGAADFGQAEAAGALGREPGGGAAAEVAGPVAADRLGLVQPRPDEAVFGAGQGHEGVVLQAGPAQGVGGGEATGPGGADRPGRRQADAGNAAEDGEGLFAGAAGRRR